MTTAFATLADLEARYPQELTLLAADETTGERDDARIDHALEDASIEVKAILQARYSPSDLDGLDAASLAVLRVYTSDIALYRVAISFARSSEMIKERYEQSVKRLEAIASGKGALSSVAVTAGGGGETGPIDQNEAVIVAPERVFTRKRLGKI